MQQVHTDKIGLEKHISHYNTSLDITPPHLSSIPTATISSSSHSGWCYHTRFLPGKPVLSPLHPIPVSFQTLSQEVVASKEDRKEEHPPLSPTDSIVEQGIHSQEQERPESPSPQPSFDISPTSTSTTNPDNMDMMIRNSSLARKEAAANKSRDTLNSHIQEESKMMADAARLNSLSIRFTKFKAILDTPVVDLESLKKLGWSGIPDEIRPTVWKLLMGYLPTNSDRRESTLQRKRNEYQEYVSQSYEKGISGLDQALYHQIHIDIQRTNAHIPLYQNIVTREALERILYIWAIRHPASGYVQGINDLLTPFFQVFLQEQAGLSQSATPEDVETYDPALLEKERLSYVEADSFWCLTKLLDGIQDNYIHAQPGIQRQVIRLKELINRIDAPLHAHLQTQGVEFIQFAFRWMNCMLMRELPLKNIIRMWDTYMSESDGFSEFHLYVCAAFLVKWSVQLKGMEFQDIMMHLQSLPTSNWTDKEIEMLLSEAFMWKSLFHDSPSHLPK